jgi:hypothetical protein
MISTLTLSLCLLTAPPSPEPASLSDISPPMPEYFGEPASPGLYAGAGGGHWHAHAEPEPFPGPDAYSCPHCYHRGPAGRPHKDWCISPCNLSLHYPYFPKDHGYYYFRPYNMVHVAIQRDIAASWGEDPRNPYDHKVFDRVYEALRAEEEAQAEVLPPSSEAKPLTPPPPAPLPPQPDQPQGGSSRRPSTSIILRPASMKTSPIE